MFLSGLKASRSIELPYSILGENQLMAKIEEVGNSAWLKGYHALFGRKQLKKIKIHSKNNKTICSLHN